MQLVIAEKPSVARNIAEVLGATSFQGGFMEGNGYVVSWCIGHLVELEEPEAYGEQWKKWTYESLPVMPETWQYKVKNDTREQFEILCRLMNIEEITEIVCATDAGREGELIFRLVYEKAGCKKPVKRLWISSMEESAIRAGFENLRPGEEYENLYHSALCRQEADWLVGINGTRLFTVLYGSKVLKVGRVQTPTLAMLAEREEKIRNFKQEDYYTVHLLSGSLDMVSRAFADKKAAEELAQSCNGGNAVVTSVLHEEKTVMPPLLYDLTTLQRDANRLLGFTAKQTLEYTQSLYEKKLCTYPRTDSRYLSDDMGQTAEQVIEAVFRQFSFVPPVIFNPNIARVLDSKKVTDHHAIIPTMEICEEDLAAIPETERKILSLIAARLLSAVCEKHIYQTVKTEFTCNGHSFSASGKIVLVEGFRIFEEAYKNAFVKAEKNKTEEKSLPELAEGMVFDNVQTKVAKNHTSPPKRFTEDSLLSAMERAGNEDMNDDVERKGLGTPATRADIIEKLVSDGFAVRQKKNIVPTEDGMKLIAVLPDIVKSPKLTADWENALSLVAKGEMEHTVFQKGIVELVNNLIAENKEPTEEGRKIFAEEVLVLGTCPNCKKEIVRGRYGAYCVGKCGMNVSRYYKKSFTDAQIKDLITGKKILLKGLIGKNDKPYDLYLEPTGIEEYSYQKDGETIKGYQFTYEKSFPKNNKQNGRKEG